MNDQLVEHSGIYIKRFVDGDRLLPGVVILGGGHGALAVARNFGRQSIPVILVNDRYPLAKLSRYIRQSFSWPAEDQSIRCNWLSDLAWEQNLYDWLLIPCGDDELRMVSENAELLRSDFQVISCDWRTLYQFYDKKRLSAVVSEAGLEYPAIDSVGSSDEANSITVKFPAILRAADRGSENILTPSKAWLVNSRTELVTLYDEINRDNAYSDVSVQEFIVGGGESQFSYIGLWHDNTPIAEMAARRTRQYPIELGQTSTLVETVSIPEIRALARRLLSSIGFDGFVEIEFKFDANDGRFKLIDVKPRPPSWVGLCNAAGINFSGVLVQALAGERIVPVGASQGHAWINPAKDVMTSIQLFFHGRLTASDYLKSICQNLCLAAFALRDPLPGLMELPSAILQLLLNGFFHSSGQDAIASKRRLHLEIRQ